MKKMLLAVGVFCIQNTFAQTIVDFEDLTVPAADSAWLGSTGEGGFTSHGVFFENSYTVTQWGDYWGGFIYSNSTDVVTPGNTNDYSAYAGSGANNSANYAVFYNGTIDLNTEKVVGSIALTNTTYAALSMLNGDAFGKQFGSVNNANGDPDGTNGNDWFRVLIIGSDAQQNVTDTVIFYLADYRFTNNQQDYILDTWQNVDLTSLGNIRYIDFVLESSDVGNFGMNTPAYFALDNLTIGTLGIQANEVISLTAYPNPAQDVIQVTSPAGILKVFSTAGVLLHAESTSGETSIDLSALSNGTYLMVIETAQGTTTSTIVKH